VSTSDGIIVASMDDGRANALSLELISALLAAVDDATRAKEPLVLAGREGRFCAGFDLAVMRSGDRAAVTELLTAGARLFRALCEAPVPVLAACTGHALAGGALLLLCADYRVAATGSYRIGLNEVSIGMALPEFAVELARHRLNPAHVTSATMFAEVGDPTAAREMGYADDVAADAVAVASARAKELARLSGKPFSVTKSRLRRPLLERFDALGL
jgi:enoyl-CoA hydratase